MDEGLCLISIDDELSADAVKALYEVGFVVIPGLIAPDRLKQLSAAYDSAIALAGPDDLHVGSTTTRVSDLANRGSEFDALYIQPYLLNACSHVIGQRFKLSSIHARTLHQNTPAQRLHIDFKANEEKFPLMSFIWMIDEFCSDNGATRFVPGSHNWSAIPHELTDDRLGELEDEILLACGQPGSLIIFNGSVLHGHSANTTGSPRRSIQGAFIPRNAQSGTDFSIRMGPETRDRIGPAARYLLAV